jgi:hypothetical protein
LGRCGFNDYEISLYSCDNGNYSLVNTIAPLQTCSSLSNSLLNCPINYICVVSNSSLGGPPLYPVFVEWYWYQEYTARSPGTRYCGKLTFVGTKKWLDDLYIANGNAYTSLGPYSFGLPLLNTANHSTP